MNAVGGVHPIAHDSQPKSVIARAQVAQDLTQLMAAYDKEESIIWDNGTELTGTEREEFYDRGIQLLVSAFTGGLP